MRTKEFYHLLAKMNILKELGYVLKPESMILDFGCGEGRSVQELRGLGYQAFGCDIRFTNKESKDIQLMYNENIIRLINTHPYKLPFEDSTFDFIFSDQVFEHVQNYSETISELKRILKPDGCCLHIFPSRYGPIESHKYVPFSSIIKSYSWLLFWAKMGIRKKSQAGLSATEIANQNYNFLKNNTNYLSKKQITKEFKKYFKTVLYCENLFLKHSRKGRHVYFLSKIFTFLPSIFSTLRVRVLFTAQPNKLQLT
ncbi:MAG: methyltransferase domain-containing protein [Bacteroidetes bacterium]|nr:methyltransferase domain-containing protein [Bacteroidota bacterium]